MFSQPLLQHRIARNAHALERIALAKARIQSILDRDCVAHEKTLEQKIADQGPSHQRVDPHLISLAVMDLIELNRLAVHQHPIDPEVPWYSNIGRPAKEVAEKLDSLAPLYAEVSNTLSNQIGDALEVATFLALQQLHQAAPRHHFEGHFFLNRPKNRHGRFERRAAPLHLGDYITDKAPDFFLHGHNPGTLCIECKNYREWLYPTKPYIKRHILRCNELGAIPLLIARRIHYSTLTNLLVPAGIIAHETLHQYFPSDKAEVAERAKHKRSLGFTDIIAGETVHTRTSNFFNTNLARVVEPMAEKWFRNRAVLGPRLITSS